MTYIEILGTPGSGKSTIVSKLKTNESIFAGTGEDAIKRIFFKEPGWKARSMYYIVPPILHSLFFQDEVVANRLANRAFAQFVIKYPKFLEILSELIQKLSYDQDKVLMGVKTTAERFQLGMLAKKPDEYLILEEGFSQRAESFWYRMNKDTFPLEKYFIAVPIPDILIHINAPSELCLYRQKHRKCTEGRVIISDTDDQERSRNICIQVSNHLKLNYDVKVLTVENTESVVDVVTFIEERLKELIDF